MKNFISLLFLLCMSFGLAYSQSNNVGIGTKTPEKSAILEISSNSKGLLIPRMTEMDRLNIENPVEGLLVYQMDSQNGFFYYTNSNWEKINGISANSIAASNPDNWSKTGDAGTSPLSNFIGTTDLKQLVFKTNNIVSGWIDPSTKRLTYFGYRSGETNTSTGTGTYNTGVGYEAMTNMTTGGDNAAFGSRALFANTTGGRNAALGSFALTSNTTGSNNMGIGLNALRNNLDGSNNVAIGRQASFSNISGSQNVSIGTDAGYSSLGNYNVFVGYRAGYNETGNEKLYIANSNTATPLIYGNFSAKFVSIGDVDPAKREAANTSGGYNLLVKGGILTEKVKVALASSADWADYVFEPDYKLLSLEEVEDFTLENKHLPNVPSANEMAKEGLDINSTSKMFMEKIEELTLYMIELNKEVKALKSENQELRKYLK